MKPHSHPANPALIGNTRSLKKVTFLSLERRTRRAATPGGYANYLQHSAIKGVDILPQLCKGFTYMEKGVPLLTRRGACVSAPTLFPQLICRESVTDLMIE
jgi:hypothetical protein